ncbi:MAG: LEPR-XLL domain-containing protein [Sulfuritalea sp.]|nr:LEPR-XLL domain-containing protein [Sulfuritalea sp.]
MLRWLKNLSRSPLPEAGSESSVPAEGNLHAHGKFRLEALEPRVLLSGDSMVAAVAYQALLDAEAKGASVGVTAIVEQLDAEASAESSLVAGSSEARRWEQSQSQRGMVRKLVSQFTLFKRRNRSRKIG